MGSKRPPIPLYKRSIRVLHSQGKQQNFWGGNMIDFTIPEETKAIRDKVRAFVQSE